MVPVRHSQSRAGNGGSDGDDDYATPAKSGHRKVIEKGPAYVPRLNRGPGSALCAEPVIVSATHGGRLGHPRLRNRFNHCFKSSVWQCLSSLLAVRRSFVTEAHTTVVQAIRSASASRKRAVATSLSKVDTRLLPQSGGQVTQAFCALLCAMWKVPSPFVDVAPLHAHLPEKFDGTTQEDAAEYLDIILQRIGLETNQAVAGYFLQPHRPRLSTDSAMDVDAFVQHERLLCDSVISNIFDVSACSALLCTLVEVEGSLAELFSRGLQYNTVRKMSRGVRVSPFKLALCRWSWSALPHAQPQAVQA